MFYLKFKTKCLKCELLKLGAANVSASLEQTSQQILINADSMRVALDEGTEGFRQSVTQTQQAFASNGA